MPAKISIIPALQYRDAKAAIDFLSKAFGFEKNAVYEAPDGSIAHAHSCSATAWSCWVL